MKSFISAVYLTLKSCKQSQASPVTSRSTATLCCFALSCDSHHNWRDKFAQRCFSETIKMLLLDNDDAKFPTKAATCCCYPTPSKEWEDGGRPLIPRIGAHRRVKRIETARDCRGHECRSLSSQLINRVVSRKKRMSGDLLSPNTAGGKRRQFLPERWR